MNDFHEEGIEYGGVQSSMSDFRVSTTYFHINNRYTSSTEGGFNRQGKIIGSIGTIFLDTYGADNPTAAILTEYLRDVDLEHRNLGLTAAAIYILYSMLNNGEKLTPGVYKKYFEANKGRILGKQNMTSKNKKVDYTTVEVNMKVGLYNYLMYYINNIEDFKRLSP